MSAKFKAGRLWPAALLGLGLLILPAPGLAQGEVLNFKQLAPFVDVKIPGWEMAEKPSGTTVKQGNVTVSEARATFRAGDRTLEITIMDFLGKPMPFLERGQQPEVENAGETSRTTEVQGFKGLEYFRPQDKQGELHISVADRFWVKLEGDGINHIEVLEKAAQQLELKKLASLGK